MAPEMLNEWIQQRNRLFDALKGSQPLERLVDACVTAMKEGKQILAFGNGGSATQASHFAAELVNKFRIQRRPLAAISLASDTAVLTSVSNDDSFDKVFSRQIEALGRPGDVALGLTTSGRSRNVLEGLKEARKKGMIVVAFCGKFCEGAVAAGTEFLLSIDSEDTPAIQEMHLFALHYLAEMIEREIVGENHD